MRLRRTAVGDGLYAGGIPNDGRAGPRRSATRLRELVGGGRGLDDPSGFDIAPDGRIFVLERAGKVKVIKNGQLLAQPFADLPSAASGDRGLLGIAFDPHFGQANHYVYFYYTGLDLLNHLVRFDASGDVGAEGPYQIFATQSPSQLLHVGGSIAFGPDGKLYLAVGDNGYPANAQDLSNPARQDPAHQRRRIDPIRQPFLRPGFGKLGAIWAYGFRNPWRFQFDTATGNCTAATSATPRGKSSTASSPVETTVGRSPRASVLRTVPG